MVEFLRIKHPKMGKDAVKARVIEKNVFMVLKVFVADRSRARLPGCRRDCAADCRFQFHKGGQLFIATHNETLSVPVCRLEPGLCFSPRLRSFAKFYSRSHDAVIRIYDEAGNGLDEADLYWGRVATQHWQ